MIAVAASGLHGPPHRALLRFADRVLPCVLGRRGAGADKVEGDGFTPAALLPLRRVLFRADRVPPPASTLPRAPIAPEDGWCDDPADPRYNRPVRLPHGARTETLWRDDTLYDVVVPLGWNDAPPVPGRGSAIFLHCAPPDGGPTAGCIGLSLPDLLLVLRAGVTAIDTRANGDG